MDSLGKMMLHLPEVFLIVVQEKEDMAEEEKRIAKEMAIRDVNFSQGCGVYRYKEDAIAVAKRLVENKSTRKLAVMSAVAEEGKKS